MTCVLTLRLDPASQRFFETLRQRHFPPARNLIPAHLTLFHTLPDTIETCTALERVVQPAFPLSVTGLRPLGSGVAYTLASPELQELHRRLAERFAGELTAQDTQRFQPHVVVQNKSMPERARLLLEELQAGFKPFRAQAAGLDLWHYLGGPWQLAQHYPFAS